MQFKTNAHRCHYLKFSLSLDEQLSIRYHFTFQDKQDYENKYVLKHHSLKTDTIINEKMALMLIKQYCIKKEEIVSHIAFLGKIEREHRKLVISEEYIKQVNGGPTDEIIKTSEINQRWRE